MAAVGVNYEMHLKACTGLSHASNNPLPKLRIIPSNSGRGRISSFSLTCKSHSPGANLVFPPSLPLSSLVWLRWQLECSNLLGFAWIMETDVGGVCAISMYVLKLMDQQELHLFSHVFRILSHFAIQIYTSNGNAPSSPI
jgi:hypothetical protein